MKNVSKDIGVVAGEAAVAFAVLLILGYAVNKFKERKANKLSS